VGRRFVLVGGIVLLLLLVLTSLAVGSNPISPIKVGHALLNPLAEPRILGISAGA
jgi:iron complex transport system permease protein